VSVYPPRTKTTTNNLQRSLTVNRREHRLRNVIWKKKQTLLSSCEKLTKKRSTEFDLLVTERNVRYDKALDLSLQTLKLTCTRAIGSIMCRGNSYAADGGTDDRSGVFVRRNTAATRKNNRVKISTTTTESNGNADRSRRLRQNRNDRRLLFTCLLIGVYFHWFLSPSGGCETHSSGIRLANTGGALRVGRR